MKRVLLLVLVVLVGCSREDEGGIDVATALGGIADDGFLRADAPREFRFPEDHNAHPAFRNEWWYITGNLHAADGERFGYQVTFFRIALAPEVAARDSAWSTRQLWMAHVALSQIDRGRHQHDQRLARGALGLSGQETGPFRVWLEDWRIDGEVDGAFPWTLQVAAEDFDLALTLEPRREPVLQGDAGLSQKSAQPGNASYYYSITRLATTGTVTRDGQAVTVEGMSWLDREWSTSALGAEQVGWDWFSLQLDSGDDLMVYRLRNCDGGTDPHSAGLLLSAAGHRRVLAAEDFELTPRRRWTSPSGAVYPVAWSLRVPDEGIDLVVDARLDDQEMLTGVRYWEGSVAVRSSPERADTGIGYLEMTGYGPAASCDEPGGRL
jgi:predicted secreted hydrolase